MSKDNKQKKLALYYANELKWSVLPVYGIEDGVCTCSAGRECMHPGKHPATGKGVKDATTDPGVIDRWWGQSPLANIGIATGKRSNLLVLDVDGIKGRKSLESLELRHGKLPRTTVVQTGNGRHYYFRLGDQSLGNSVGKLGAGLDTRGNGGYVVAPRSIHASGRPYRFRVRNGIKKLRPAKLPTWLANALTGSEVPAEGSSPARAPEPAGRAETYVNDVVAKEIARLRKAAVGRRNDALNKAAFKIGQLLGYGVVDEEVVSRQLNETAVAIGLAAAESLATIASGFAGGKASPRELPFAVNLSEQGTSPDALLPTAAEDALARELSALGETDADNGQRFAIRHQGKILYAPGRDFLVYDQTRWCSDSRLQKARLAEETARAIAAEAQHLNSDADRAKRARFGQQSLSKGALDRMLELAKRRLVVATTSLDADPLLLNALNGTIDLRTGQLRAHDPADHLTKLVPIHFDPAATCPVFERFLDQALQSNAELVDFLQRAVGYSLTGDTREQVFFFCYGPGRSGKSTFVNSIRDLLGDYGLHTPTETLLTKKFDNGIPADLARLQGARMVSAVEANWNRALDEARIKSMTGGEPITARFLRDNFFEFTPEFKLWFAANDFPDVRDTSGAFWERVRVIPFMASVAEKDRDLDLMRKLQDERPGILAWAVRGCQKWRRKGLGKPPAVEQATGDWKTNADHVRKFLDEMVVQDQTSRTGSSDLFQFYSAWSTRHGETPVSIIELKKRLLGHGLAHKRSNSGSVWQGIKLRID